ncbi:MULTISPECIES: hypothetical protein [unclassified Pseudoclavibacter]|uniref:hypothetical protein n=1 Tax=unclassified Pseudoclavibacter TaxID=2615177 RepID=UPI0013017985|nr:MULTISPECIES: hypothetical protein [unclassified Pseudoclavibacter]KAB1645750.1 hypothetical protein F8O06_09375 [Pseudoclavibacter sp. CFCC 14310]KAB1664341.1 hypothetical protein F8O08_02775 [Pseudoclavibacter sp. CFCC 13611]
MYTNSPAQKKPRKPGTVIPIGQRLSMLVVIIVFALQRALFPASSVLVAAISGAVIGGLSALICHLIVTAVQKSKAPTQAETKWALKYLRWSQPNMAFHSDEAWADALRRRGVTDGRIALIGPNIQQYAQNRYGLA